MKRIEKILDKYFEVWGISPFEIYKDILVECRNKSRLPEKSKTVISVLFPYYMGESAYKNTNVSRYACVIDYHKVAEKYLYGACDELKKICPENEFVFFADNSPVPEVYACLKSGIGMKGRNGLLINEKYGSWVFIGEIVTDMDMSAEEKEIKFCPDCGKCKSACPTEVLKNDVFEPDKCLSSITQKKGEIEEEYKNLMRKLNIAWGCDECQKVCPYNINAERTHIKEFIDSFSPVVTKDTPIENRAFNWRGEKVIRRNLEITEK